MKQSNHNHPKQFPQMPFWWGKKIRTIDAGISFSPLYCIGHICDALGTVGTTKAVMNEAQTSNMNMGEEINSPNEARATKPTEVCDEDLPECRICRDSTGPLISSTCRCNSVVHANCLRQWQGYRADALFPLLCSSSRNVCEVCRHPVTLSTVRTTEAPINYALHHQPLISQDRSVSISVMTKYDACCLLPRAIRAYIFRLCEDVFTVESCLFIFLFVLAVMGHALFVLSVYKGAEQDEHSLKRVCLAAANALVTLSLLILAQKLASRWLRELDNDGMILPITNNPPSSLTEMRRADVGDDQGLFQHSGESNITERGLGMADIESQAREYRAYTTRCTTFSQVLLGAFLSVIAAAEIFFLVRELPLGGLAWSFCFLYDVFVLDICIAPFR